MNAIDLFFLALAHTGDADRCAAVLALVRRRLELLNDATRNPLAWCSLELLAAALGIEGPGEELRRLWLAESLLAAALAWHRRRAHQVDELELEAVL